MSAIDVTRKAFFERVYLILGLRTIALWVNCNPQPRPFTLQLFLDVRAIFSPNVPSLFWSSGRPPSACPYEWCKNIFAFWNRCFAHVQSLMSHICNKSRHTSWVSHFAHPPAPMNHVKISKGWSLRDAPSKLVQLWYQTFPDDHSGQLEMKKPTRSSNKSSTAWSCVEDQILENKNLQKMILNICTEW